MKVYSLIIYVIGFNILLQISAQRFGKPSVEVNSDEKLLKETLKKLNRIMKNMGKFTEDLKKLKKTLITIQSLQKKISADKRKKKYNDIITASESNTKKNNPLDNYSSLALSFFAKRFNTASVSEIVDGTSIDVCGAECKNQDYKFKDQVAGSTNDGILVKGCGYKEFLLSKVMKPQVDLSSYCCSLGMEGASVESKRELDCINDAYKNESKNIRSATAYLTSYTDHKLDRVFKSCPEKFPIPQRLWALNEPNNILKMEGCVAVRLTSFKALGYEDRSCIDILNLMCQFQNLTLKETMYKPRRNLSSEPKYTAYQNTQYDVLFGKGSTVKERCNRLKCSFLVDRKSLKYEYDGKLQLPSSEGFIVKGCGNKHFLFTPTQSYIQNSRLYCCMLGMEVARITSIEQLMCVHKALKNTGNKKVMTTYGTEISDVALNRTFLSCNDDPLLDDDLWIKGQPNNELGVQSCTVVQMFSNFSNVGYDDVACTARANYMCEYTVNFTVPLDSNNNTLAKTMYTQPMKMSLQNSSYYNCKSTVCGSNTAVPKFGKDNKLILSDNSNILLTGCGKKQYVLTSIKVPYSEIWNACCGLGMKPALIENKDELNCIKNIYSKMPGYNKDFRFYTSQLDAKVDRNFVSCPSFRPVSTDLWASGQPDNDQSREGCVALIFNPANLFGLHDVFCGDASNVICEVSS